MKSLPQRTYVNPALRCDSRFFVGIPALSSIFIDFSNSSLQLNKISEVLDRKSDDSVVINLNKIPNMFRERNSISTEVSLDLLHAGFELGDNNFFSVNASLHTSGKVSFNRDLPKLLFEGNGGKNLAYPFDLGSRVDLLQYAELGLGYSRRLKNDRLAIGFRVKYLRGILNLNTERSDIQFRTDPNSFELIASSDIRLNYTADMEGFTEEVKDVSDLPVADMFKLSQFSDVFGRNNNGWGLDVGATYDLTKKIELSGSIINLGRIYWNNGVRNYTSRNPGDTYVFKGMEFNNLDSLEDGEYLFNNLMDTLADRFGLDSSSERYSTGLFPEFYLGGTFSFTKNHRLGALFYGDWYQKRLHPGFSVTWYSQIARSLSLSISYSIIDNSFNNLGLGLATNAGPFQFYILSDNIFQVATPDAVRNWNVRTGFNLTFLRKPKENKKYEKK